MIVQPTLFSPIVQFVVLANAERIIFELEDNYQKQTYRNRYIIYGANGKQVLTVPVIHSHKGVKIKTKDVKIDHRTDWHKLHVRSLQSAYRSSPFYEFYEDEIMPVFFKKQKYLIDLNFDAFEVVCEAFQAEFKFKKTKEYQINTKNEEDYRSLAIAKTKQIFPLQKYTQVFDDKYGFLPNLSILDLIFNEGPNALMYLEKHNKLLFKS